MKLHLHTLVGRGDWDDVLPDELRPLWISHLKMMQDIGKIKVSRAVVPEDAINLEIQAINVAAASQRLAGVAIYAKCLRINGTLSCQPVFSRSKLTPVGLSQPSAELVASIMNTQSHEIISRKLQGNHKGKMKLTDSQVVLHWLRNYEKAVKQWMRNQVVKILIFTDSLEWFQICEQGELMI